MDILDSARPFYVLLGPRGLSIASIENLMRRRCKDDEQAEKWWKVLNMVRTPQTQ